MTATDTAPAVETLEFDALYHLYKLRPSGRVLPSVTSILRLAGLTDFSMVKPDVLEAKRALGQAVHEATHFLDDQDLDLTSLDPRIVPYVTAWEAAKKETGFVPLRLETAVWHPAHLYAGTFDRLGYVSTVAGNHLVLGDLKTGNPDDACAQLQTAAYLEAVPEAMRALVPNANLVPLRWSFQLKPDGNYMMREYRDYRDFRVFLAALQVVNFNAGRNRR